MSLGLLRHNNTNPYWGDKENLKTYLQCITAKE